MDSHISSLLPLRQQAAFNQSLTKEAAGSIFSDEVTKITEKLPTEIVDHIISFLPTTERRMIYPTQKKLAEMSLRRVKMQNPQGRKFEDKSFKNESTFLLKLPQLEELTLHNHTITDNTLIMRSLFELRSVKKLILDNCTFSFVLHKDFSASTQIKKRSSRLQESNAEEFHVLPKQVQRYTIAHLTHLKAVALNCCTLMPEISIKDFTKLSNIRNFSLNSCSDIRDHDILLIARLTELEELGLVYCSSVTENGIQSLSSLTKIKSLNLQYCQVITPAIMQTIAGLTKLETLVLNGCHSLTDADVQPIAQLTKLKTLVLGYRVSDAIIQNITQSLKLKALVLSNSELLTDTGIQAIFGSSTLETLILRGSCALTDINMQTIFQLANLKTLDLIGSRSITESGAKEIAQLTQLETLVPGSCISNTGLADLKQALPKLSILQLSNSSLEAMLDIWDRSW